VNALLAAPDRSAWTGRRDHTLLRVAVQTGLRASELTGLNRGDVHLHTGPHVSCRGKGRKQRVTPLTRTTTTALRAWLDERGGQADEALFPTSGGRRLSRDAVERRLATHTATAARRLPIARQEEGHAPRAATYRGDAAPACRRRQLRDRSGPRCSAGLP
jgi:integrase/recombinase XerD